MSGISDRGVNDTYCLVKLRTELDFFLVSARVWIWIWETWFIIWRKYLKQIHLFDLDPKNESFVAEEVFAGVPCGAWFLPASSHWNAILGVSADGGARLKVGTL